jgi:hypothetical protein
MLGFGEHHIEGVSWHKLRSGNTLNFVTQSYFEVVRCPAVVVVAHTDLSEDSSEFRVKIKDGAFTL